MRLHMLTIGLTCLFEVLAPLLGHRLSRFPYEILQSFESVFLIFGVKVQKLHSSEDVKYSHSTFEGMHVVFSFEHWWTLLLDIMQKGRPLKHILFLLT